MPTDLTLELHDDPAAFLEAAGALLTAEPVLGSVIASVTSRMARQVAEGVDPWPTWWRRSVRGGWSSAAATRPR
jgi:hypothetical protein